MDKPTLDIAKDALERIAWSNDVEASHLANDALARMARADAEPQKRAKVPRPNSDRCEALVDGGITHCLREGVASVGGEWFCRQHAELVKRTGYVTKGAKK